RRRGRCRQPRERRRGCRTRGRPCIRRWTHWRCCWPADRGIPCGREAHWLRWRLWGPFGKEKARRVPTGGERDNFLKRQSIPPKRGVGKRRTSRQDFGGDGVADSFLPHRG